MKKSAKVVLLASLLSVGLFSPVYLLWAFLKLIGMLGIPTIGLVWITTDIAILTFHHGLVIIAILNIKLVLVGITIVMR